MKITLLKETKESTFGKFDIISQGDINLIKQFESYYLRRLRSVRNECQVAPLLFL